MFEHESPPTAPRVPVTDVYHGVKVTDPYRWMEEDAAALERWVDEQKAYCAGALHSLPGRAERRRAAAAASADRMDVVNVQIGGERLFYLKRAEGAQVHSLVTRSRIGGAEQVIVDTEARAPGNAHHRSIDWYSASPDGRFVVYAMSRDGSEQATLHLIDLASGTSAPVERATALASRMTRVRYPGVAWSPDSRRFVYQRLTVAQGTAKYQNVTTAVCEVSAGADGGGSVDSAARAVASICDLGLDADDTPIVSFSGDGGGLVVGVRSGCLRTCPVFFRPFDPGADGWRRLSDAAVAWYVDGDDAFLLEPGDDGLGRLTWRRIADQSPPTVLFGGGPVVEDFSVGPDEILLRCLDGGRSLVVRLDRRSGRATPVGLPYDGHVTEWAYDAAEGDLVFALSSWIRPPRSLRLRAGDDVCRDTAWWPAAPEEGADVVSTRLDVPASDGTAVPMTVVHRRDVVLDGTNRALLVAYGFFGISLRALFQPALVDWVAEGNVWAVAHVRGGGEKGERWAAAGHGVAHNRTIDDLLDCADHLIEAGWTSADRLAAEGTSAGGLTAAGAMVRRPDRFAAVVLRVPVTNTLRLEMYENGPPNIPEYGTSRTAEGLPALLVSDVCHRIEETVAYPPVLVTMGRNDPRVAAFQPAKLVAHLQHAAMLERPVLLRVEDDAGHGPGSTRSQVDDELADRLTFLDAMLPGAASLRHGDSD